MPYSIRRSGNKYQVITTDTGNVHGTHPTRAAALQQLQALYVHASPGKEGISKKKVAKSWTSDYMKRKR